MWCSHCPVIDFVEKIKKKKGEKPNGVACGVKKTKKRGGKAKRGNMWCSHYLIIDPIKKTKKKRGKKPNKVAYGVYIIYIHITLLLIP